MARVPAGTAVEQTLTAGDPPARAYTFAVAANDGAMGGLMVGHKRGQAPETLVDDSKYTFSAASGSGPVDTVTFLDAPAVQAPFAIQAGDVIRVFRDTSTARVSDFSRSSIVVPGSLEQQLGRTQAVVEELTARTEIHVDQIQETVRVSDAQQRHIDQSVDANSFEKAQDSAAITFSDNTGGGHTFPDVGFSALDEGLLKGSEYEVDELDVRGPNISINVVGRKATLTLEIPTDNVNGPGFISAGQLARLTAMEDGATADLTGPEIVALLSALQGAARLSVNDLNDVGDAVTEARVYAQVKTILQGFANSFTVVTSDDNTDRITISLDIPGLHNSVTPLIAEFARQGALTNDDIDHVQNILDAFDGGEWMNVSGNPTQVPAVGEHFSAIQWTKATIEADGSPNAGPYGIRYAAGPHRVGYVAIRIPRAYSIGLGRLRLRIGVDEESDPDDGTEHWLPLDADNVTRISGDDTYDYYSVGPDVDKPAGSDWQVQVIDPFELNPDRVNVTRTAQVQIGRRVVERQDLVWNLTGGTSADVILGSSGLDPAFDLTAPGNARGEFHYSLDLRLDSVTDANMGWVAQDPSARELNLSGIVFAGDVGESTELAFETIAGSGGVAAVSQNLYSVATNLGRVVLKFVRQGNIVSTFAYWEGLAGATTPVIRGELRVTYLPSDSQALPGFQSTELFNQNVVITTANLAMDTGFDLPQSGHGSEWLLVNFGKVPGGAPSFARGEWHWVRTGDIGIGTANGVGLATHFGITNALRDEFVLTRNAANRLFIEAGKTTLGPTPLTIRGVVTGPAPAQQVPIAGFTTRGPLRGTSRDLPQASVAANVQVFSSGADVWTIPEGSDAQYRNRRSSGQVNDELALPEIPPNESINGYWAVSEVDNVEIQRSFMPFGPGALESDTVFDVAKASLFFTAPNANPQQRCTIWYINSAGAASFQIRGDGTGLPANARVKIYEAGIFAA